MYEHTFQHRVAVSNATLPIAACLTVAAWMSGDWSDWRLWAGLALTAAMAYFVAVWNSVYMLLRIRSRLVSSTYLVLVAACPFLHRWDVSLIPAACALGVYFLLFRSYQKSRPEPDVFHAFIFYGVGSLFFPQWLYFVPVFWGAMLIRLRSLTLRSISAAVLGLMLPYWALAAYAVWQNRLDTAFLFLSDLLRFDAPSYAGLPLSHVVSFAFVSFYLVLGVVHFSRTAYNDRIRVRMYLRLLITQAVLLGAFLVAQPRHFDVLFPLYVLTASPIIGHYLALVRGRFMGVWFVLSLLLFGGLFVFNSVVPWMPLSTFL